MCTFAPIFENCERMPLWDTCSQMGAKVLWACGNSLVDRALARSKTNII